MEVAVAKHHRQKQATPRGTIDEQELRAAQAAYGRSNEERVLYLLERHISNATHRPPWLVSIRRATEEEDVLGIDLVAITVDSPNVYIQIKSSESFRKIHIDKGRKLWRAGATVHITGVMIANHALTDKKIIGRGMATISRVYRTVKNLGSNIMPSYRHTGDDITDCDHHPVNTPEVP